MALRETKLSSLDEVSIPHFHIVSFNRFNSRCLGGIPILLENDLKEYVKITHTPRKVSYGVYYVRNFLDSKH